MKVTMPITSLAQLLDRRHALLQLLGADDHAQYLKEKASGGLASETPTHAHTAAAEAGQLDHGLALIGLADDDHGQYWNDARGDAKIAAHRAIVEAHQELFPMLKRYRFVCPWQSLAAITVGGDVGYVITAAFSKLYMAPYPYAVNPDAWAYGNAGWSDFITVGKQSIVEFNIANVGFTTANIWLRLAQAVADPPSETARHVGFKMIDTAIWASHANGANQVITDTGEVLDFAARNVLRVEVNQGVDVKFYVNNVLKVTHTTYLPPANNYGFHFHIRNTSEGLAAYMNVDRLYLEREY